jgi:hypothetical protein
VIFPSAGPPALTLSIFEVLGKHPETKIQNKIITAEKLKTLLFIIILAFLIKNCGKKTTKQKN